MKKVIHKNLYWIIYFAVIAVILITSMLFGEVRKP